MTLLLAITAISFTAFGAGLGIGFGCRYGARVAARVYVEQLAEIAALNHQLYEQPAYGDD